MVVVDLAGKTTSNAPLDGYSATLKLVAQEIVKECVVKGRTGGFGTSRLTRSVKGMAEAYTAPNGYGKINSHSRLDHRFPKY